jgi:type IV pilus assembly protein PilE
MIPGPTSGFINAPESRGVTLIELVLVCALIGIALGLALPGYHQYTLRAHRSEAIGELYSMAACQEGTRAFNGAYDTGNCAQAIQATHYEIVYEPESTPSTPVFRLEARPVGAQTDDSCGILTLDHAGNRSTSEAGEMSIRCWEGR